MADGSAGYMSQRRRRELMLLAWPFKGVAWSLRVNGQDTGDIERDARAILDRLAERPRDMQVTAGLWDDQSAAMQTISRSTALAYFSAVVLCQHVAEQGMALPDDLVAVNEALLERLSEASAEAFEVMERSSRQRAQKWLSAWQAAGYFQRVPPVPQIEKQRAKEVSDDRR